MTRTYKILVIDDEEIICETYKMQLYIKEYEIIIKNRAKAGLEYLENELPDLILLDVMMPEMDGFTACKLIKDNAKWKHIPIILITALEGKNNLIKGLESGADEFLSKPVNGPELRARVRSMLRIKQQYDELEENMKTREYLSHMIMHDIRNPLLSIAMMCEISMSTIKQENGNTQIYDNFNKIHKEARHLNSFINDMLLVTKLESGKLKLHKKEIKLQDIIHKSIVNHEMLANRRGITFNYDLESNSETVVNIDENLFLRVIDNIISNAIKYSNDDSKISIKIASDEDTSKHKTVIQIMDEGVGIANESKEKIFNKYETLELKKKNALQTGFGLAFCKMVVNAHEGIIYVEDNEPKGAKFVIEI